MNLFLTDQLDCPRCLDGAGLILLPDRTEGRVVHAGQLGCPLCRTRFPIVDGVADFGAGEPREVDAPESGEADVVAALLGVTEGPATVLMLGPFEDLAEQVANMIRDLRVVVAHAGARAATSHEGVSVLRVTERVPLRAASMRAVLLGRSGGDAVADALRVCVLTGRIVLVGATDATRSAVRAAGFRVVAEDADRMVAIRVA